MRGNPFKRVTNVWGAFSALTEKDVLYEIFMAR